MAETQEESSHYGNYFGWGRVNNFAFSVGRLSQRCERGIGRGMFSKG